MIGDFGFLSLRHMHDGRSIAVIARDAKYFEAPTDFIIFIMRHLILFLHDATPSAGHDYYMRAQTAESTT